MKKIIFALVVLLMAAPAFAANVTITCVQSSDPCTPNDVIVSFSNAGPNNVRAIALDIQLASSTATICDVTCTNAEYNIYPGSIVIEDGEVIDEGTCACSSSYPGTLAGIDTNGVTVEMGSLYVGEANAPEQSGELLRITLCGCHGTDGVVPISITANAIRGGVVMEDPDETVSLTSNGCNATIPDCAPPECMGPGHPDIDEWRAVGSPDCWCYPRQCRGDVDATQEYGAYWVLLNDLNQFKTYFQQTNVAGEPGICSDLAHDIEYGAYRVLLNDLNIIKTYFQAVSVPCCDADQDCNPDNDTYFNWFEP